MPERITLVGADDWAGVYIDGDLHYEGHSIPTFVWVELLRKVARSLLLDIEDLSETAEAYAAIESHGRCPAKWPWRDA